MSDRPGEGAGASPDAPFSVHHLGAPAVIPAMVGSMRARSLVLPFVIGAAGVALSARAPSSAHAAPPAFPLPSLSAPFPLTLPSWFPILEDRAFPSLPPMPSIGWPPPAVATSLPSVASLPTALPAATPGKVGPFTRGAPYSLKVRTDKPKLTSWINQVPFARFGSDGKTGLIASSKMARVVTDQSKLGATLASTHAHRSDFSPDVKRVVTSDEDSGELHIYALPSGKLERKLEKMFWSWGSYGMPHDAAYEVSFTDDKTVHFHNGCQLKSLDVSSATSAPVPIGVELCGRPTVSADGSRWVVAQEGKKAYGEGLWYAKVRTIDRTTGAMRVFLDESISGPMTDTVLSPVGDRLCFNRADKKLACVTIDDGKVEDVSDGPASRVKSFSADGKLMVYADRTGDITTTTLHVVDFTSRTVRKLTTVPRWLDYFGFFGGHRVYAEEQGSYAFDLDANWQMEVFTKDVEAQGWAALPGNPKKLMVSRASISTRDMYWADFPD